MSKDCDPLLLAFHFLTREVRELRCAITALDHPLRTPSISISDQHLLDCLAHNAQAIAQRTGALASGSHQPHKPSCPCGHENERPNMPTPVQEFHGKVQVIFDETNASLDSIKTEITDLNALIQSLQNSTGTLGPEDETALADIATKAAALAARAASLAPVSLPPPPPTP